MGSYRGMWTWWGGCLTLIQRRLHMCSVLAAALYTSCAASAGIPLDQSCHLRRPPSLASLAIPHFPRHTHCTEPLLPLLLQMVIEGLAAKERYCSTAEYYQGRHAHCLAGIRSFYAEDYRLLLHGASGNSSSGNNSGSGNSSSNGSSRSRSSGNSSSSDGSRSIRSDCIASE